MTEYVRVDLHHVKHGEWIAYLPDLDLIVQASSKPKAEQEAYRTIEEVRGLKSFRIIWIEE